MAPDPVHRACRSGVHGVHRAPGGTAATRAPRSWRRCDVTGAGPPIAGCGADGPGTGRSAGIRTTHPGGVDQAGTEGRASRSRRAGRDATSTSSAIGVAVAQPAGGSRCRQRRTSRRTSRGQSPLLSGDRLPTARPSQPGIHRSSRLRSACRRSQSRCGASVDAYRFGSHTPHRTPL